MQITTTDPAPSREGPAGALDARAGGAWLGAALGLLFVLSGATALVYEVVWFKRFAHVFGAAPIAIAAVVASFLLGLGLGARVIGARVDRVGRAGRWPGPLALYAWCELGIALFALLVPFELSLLRWVEASAYPLLAERALLGAFFRCALTFLVLGPPCVLMGGTLPLLVKAHSALGARIGRSVGLLYAANTFGAAIGAYLAGFHLLPALGIQATTFVAVGANLVIATVAFGLSARIPKPAPGAPAPPAGATAERGVRAPWHPPAMAFAIGGSALVLQIVWMRQMALLVGGSTYAFSAVLVVILLGIGLGSLAARAALSAAPEPERLRRLLQAAIVGLVLAVLAGQLALPMLTDLVGAAEVLRQDTVRNAAVCLLAAFALAFLPSLAFGGLFPAVVHAHFREAGTEGGTVGAIALWNTLGCLAGATLTPLVVIPALGTQAAIGVAVALAWIALLVAERVGGGLRRARAGAAALFGAALVLAAARPIDPLQLNLGAYSSGYLPPEKRPSELLFFAEGRACNVLVTGRPSRALRLNGKVDASDAGDMPTQLGCAYFSQFLRPGLRDALVIGFGSGTTSGALLLDRETRVTTCEIEAEVVAASRFFAHVNHEPERSPRFTARILDGRAYLQGSKETYDAIVSVPTNPWVAGIGNLFTQSFYAAVHERLRPGGLFVQWVQTYEQQPDDYAMIVRTMAACFENVGIIRIDDLDTLVVASDAALLPTAADVAAAQALVEARPPIGADLERYFGTRDVGRLLLRHYVAGPDNVRRLLDRLPDTGLHTDDNQRLEFSAARRLFTYTPETDALVLSTIDGTWQRALFEQLPAPEAAAGEWRGLFEAMEDAGVRGGEAVAQIGYGLAPEDPFLSMRHLLEAPPADEAAFRERVLGLAEDSPELANLLGGLFWQRQDHERAARVFEVLLERWPNSATLWANLSICQRPLNGGGGLRADATLRRAFEMDPWNEFVRRKVEPERGR